MLALKPLTVLVNLAPVQPQTVIMPAFLAAMRPAVVLLVAILKILERGAQTLMPGAAPAAFGAFVGEIDHDDGLAHGVSFRSRTACICASSVVPCLRASTIARRTCAGSFSTSASRNSSTFN